MSPPYLPLPAPPDVTFVHGVRVERCNTGRIALAFAANLRRNGIPAHVASPRTHGVWGIYVNPSK